MSEVDQTPVAKCPKCGRDLARVYVKDVLARARVEMPKVFTNHQSTLPEYVEGCAAEHYFWPSLTDPP